MVDAADREPEELSRAWRRGGAEGNLELLAEEQVLEEELHDPLRWLGPRRPGSPMEVLLHRIQLARVARREGAQEGPHRRCRGRRHAQDLGAHLAGADRVDVVHALATRHKEAIRVSDLRSGLAALATLPSWTCCRSSSARPRPGTATLSISVWFW